MSVASAQSAPSASSLVLVDPHDRAWVEFVSAQREATTFHHPAWSAVLAETYGFHSFAVALTDGAGQIEAGLPMMGVRGIFGGRRWISLPFTDHCPPLASDGSALERLVQALGSLRADRGPALIEIRGEAPGPDPVRSVRGVSHTLELSRDFDAVHKSFRRSHQRGIARANREGVTVRWASSRDDLTRRFFDLHALTRRRLGVPIQPRRFFEALWERVVEPRLGFVLVAYAKELPIAAGVFLAWNGTIVCKFSASDAEHWDRRPNHLLFWEAMRWGCESGHRRFDFGRTDLDDGGLRAFKLGWGTREEQLVYSTIGDRPPTGRSGVARRGLSAFIQHSPIWVTRAVGAALYRYAA